MATDIVVMRMGYAPAYRGADGNRGPNGVLIGTPTPGTDGSDGTTGLAGPPGTVTGTVTNGISPSDGLFYDANYNLVSTPAAVGPVGPPAIPAVNGLNGNGGLLTDDTTKWRRVLGPNFTINGTAYTQSAVAVPGDVIVGAGIIIQQID